MRWLLVRHGSTEWSETGRYAGHTDVGLSALGCAQARRLAARLADVPVDVAYTSDLRRATETLELLLAGRLPLPQVVVCQELRELHFGAWEGLTYDEVAAEPNAPAVLQGAAPPPDGESPTQLATRLARFLRRLHEDPHPGQTVVVVSHGGPLRALVCAALGLPTSLHWRFQVDPGSVSELAYDPQSGARLVRLNDCCHLEACTRAQGKVQVSGCGEGNIEPRRSSPNTTARAMQHRECGEGNIEPEDLWRLAN